MIRDRVNFRGLAALVLVATLAGCYEQDIPFRYGTRGEGSVNGTDVLTEMFTAAGHKTKTARRRMSARIGDRTDTFVWIPDTFHLPSTEERTYFDDWLLAKEGRTLIYVGRDYDAAPEFWRSLLKGAPADKVPEIKRRLADAESRAAGRRASMKSLLDCPWFRFTNEPGYKPPVLKPGDPRLFGDANWIKGLDPAKLNVPIRAPLDPVFEADILFGHDGQVLVSREKVTTHDGGTSQVIVVANGSFLTNMGLVNHEHRKLGARLVGEIGSAKQVTFVESDDNGLNFQTEEPPDEPPEMQKWPPARLRTTFLHLAALAIILIVARWPIFGRPLEDATTYESDFGRHVEALGDLLSRGGNASYAESRLDHFQRTMQEATSKGRSSS